MIRRLKGEVVGSTVDSVVLDVNGVGYLIRLSTLGTKFTLGETLTLHTYLAVRETALDLYGFLLLDELEVFELLITLPKIGPKSAIQILSQADISLLKEAVRNNDSTYLSKMSGIGKKSAEKIVLGLREKLDDEWDNDSTIATGQNMETSQASDTIDALIALGYQPNDARKVVQELPSDIQNANDAVKEALKRLSR